MASIIKIESNGKIQRTLISNLQKGLALEDDYKIIFKDAMINNIKCDLILNVSDIQITSTQEYFNNINFDYRFYLVCKDIEEIKYLINMENVMTFQQFIILV